MRRFLVVSVIAIATVSIAAPAFACGGLIGPRGSVNLLRTTTLAVYHDGIEHYITAFKFVGTGGGKFGSLVPLPGVPTKVEKAGSWTLQRLLREVQPPTPDGVVFAQAASATAGHRAEVLLETRIDALDITVLRGGAQAVGIWARENGFDLPPDSPQVLDFYARRSPIFMAARFNLKAAQARGTQQGDGTPVQITIPTDNPWVPLRILALGKNEAERIDADVFLLTDRTPALLPAPVNSTATQGSPVADGLFLDRSERASDALLADLRSDKNMGWIPASDMWLSYLRLDAGAGALGYDLAIDASGAGRPSYRDAGFLGLTTPTHQSVSGALLAALATMLVIGALAGLGARRRQVVA